MTGRRGVFRRGRPLRADPGKKVEPLRLATSKPKLCVHSQSWLFPRIVQVMGSARPVCGRLLRGYEVVVALKRAYARPRFWTLASAPEFEARRSSGPRGVEAAFSPAPRLARPAAASHRKRSPEAACAPARRPCRADRATRTSP